MSSRKCSRAFPHPLLKMKLPRVKSPKCVDSVLVLPRGSSLYVPKSPPIIQPKSKNINMFPAKKRSAPANRVNLSRRECGALPFKNEIAETKRRVSPPLAAAALKGHVVFKF
ncbi:hypothetical protein V8G54_029976, partial [Vigna mungo]